MKWLRISWAVWAAGVVAASAQCTVSFNENAWIPNSYWNGSDSSGGFTDHAVFFQNNYNPAWYSWSGFSLSNVNDTNTAGYLNQYAVFSGTGYGAAGTYLIAYDDTYGEEADVIRFALPTFVQGLYVNNSTYAALTMRNGDEYGFSKRFGGATGNDPDWFLLEIAGKDRRGRIVGTTNRYLADFRFTNNALDYIQSSWTWMDLRSFGTEVSTLHFSLSSSDSGMFGMNTPGYFALDQLVYAYAPAAGQTHSTALHMSTNLFVAWASGWTNYAPGIVEDGDTNNPYYGFNPLFMDPAKALGTASNDAWEIVSLGGGGQITLLFPSAIEDGPGWDFAVFENSVNDSFLELAWVEVSSDGSNFVRFASHSLTTNEVPFWGAYVETMNIAGVAGKYGLGFGTPFDLAELPDSPTLDKRTVRYVRLVDIMGNGSVTDSFGNAIYDPYPTTGSPGFDLDAVGVIHASSESRLAASSGGVQASWLLLSNFVYEVQWSDRLDGDQWQILGGAVTGRNEQVIVNDAATQLPGKFYRLIRRPQ
ncbi:MAG TPA: hypothetical protein DCZ95_00970 [Verrucomicrobia bacterium]|nr:MAG: hypothetical protein A2X46_12130 [Lentisphaerae bacterium GWF2_57_35]HBA82640.1 hypothetical protein [Verrucomicrobiota bacterium]